MIQIGGSQEEGYFSNSKSITGSVLKQLILAGALWSEKHFLELEKIDDNLGKQINDILRRACYEISKCSSDTVGDIFMAADQGACRPWVFHQGRPFLTWFLGLARALRDKQEISAQDFASAIQEAAGSTWHGGVIPIKAAKAAIHAAKTTQNVYEVLDKTLEEAKKRFLTRSERKKAALKETLSIGLPLILFLEGMQCYIKGQISLYEIQEAAQRIASLKVEVAKLPEISENNVERWIYEAVVILEKTIFNETSDLDIHKRAETIRDLVHAHPWKITNVLEQIATLRDILEATCYAPESYNLASDIYRIMWNSTGA